MPLPSDFQTVQVYGTYIDLNGNPASGRITFTATTRLRSAATKTSIMPGSVEVALDSNGYFTTQLPATNDPDITPSGWGWEVAEKFGDPNRPTYARTYTMLAPLGTPIDMTSVAPATPPGVAPVILVKTVAGKTPDAAGDVSLTVHDLSDATITAPTSGQVLQWNGTQWVNAAGGGGGAVTSVFGRTGAVTGAKGDVGLANVDNTADLAKPLSTAETNALAGKVDTTRTITAGAGITGGGDLTANRTLAANVGTTAGTLAAGDDTRLLGNLKAANNLSDVTNAATARTNLGITGGAADTIKVAGLVADGVTDDGPVIQAVLDNLGVTGSTHSFDVLAEAPPLGVIYINSTVQVVSSNTVLRFGSPVLFGASGRLRIQGELAETPATGKPKLTAAAAAGATTITVDSATPFAVGCYIVIRGGRDATGNPADGQKESHTVTAIAGLVLTLNEPLENAYVVNNTNASSPVGTTHDTQVTRATSSAITVAANRGDRVVTVADTSIFAAGDYVQVLDDSHTIDPTGAEELTNYKHRECAEIKQIVSATQLRLSHALYHTFVTAKNARVAKMVAIKRSTIRDATVTWSAMSTVSNGFEIRYGVQCQIANCIVAGDGAKTKSWRNQAFRQGDSYLCEVVNCYATDPADVSSGKGYGATLYGATECTIRASRFSSLRHSVLVYFGASGNLISGCISEDACISDYDLHGGECMDNLFTGCTAIGGDSTAPDSTQKTACKVGNPSHTDGDSHNTFSDMAIINFQGSAFEVIPASTNTTFRNSRVTGALTGIKLVANSGNTTLITADTYVENVDFADVTTLTNIDGGAANTMVRGVTIENCRFIRSTTGLAPANAQKVRIRRCSFYDPNQPANTYAIFANAITGFSAKDNDVSGCQRGVKLSSCPQARVTGNVMHDLVDTTVYEDTGGNTGTLFGRNDIYGFSPLYRTSGTGPTGSGVVDLGPIYLINHPGRHGLIEWNFDPTYASASGTGQAATAGSIYLHRISAQTGGTVTNVLMVLGTIGATLTTGQNLVGLYDDTGARIGITPDQTTTWGGTTGTKTMALTAPATIQAGRDYFVGILANGTTPPNFVTVAANNSVTTPNVNLSAAAQKFSVNGTGATALPTSLTLSANSSTSPRSYWVGLS